MEQARRELATAPFAPDGDEEAVMDFLADCEGFMVAINAAAQAVLGRPSRGVGDVQFEEMMVTLMDGVQNRLRIPETSGAAGRGAPG